MAPTKSNSESVIEPAPVATTVVKDDDVPPDATEKNDIETVEDERPESEWSDAEKERYHSKLFASENTQVNDDLSVTFTDVPWPGY